MQCELSVMLMGCMAANTTLSTRRGLLCAAWFHSSAQGWLWMRNPVKGGEKPVKGGEKTGKWG